MRVELKQVGKRFRRDWVLRGVDLLIEPGTRLAIVGPNGSGKSTLLKIICGHLTPSKGKVAFSLQEKTLEIDQVYTQLAYAAPYIELIEEFSLQEAIDFHQKFKPLQQGMNTQDLIALLGFERSRHNEVRNFSSGMKQRLKLALAICSQAPLLLLDEPTTNLDTQGAAWYIELIQDFGAQRSIIVASNVEADYAFCAQKVDIRGYK
jgi:ABC-type multidrug transport system ATPase subunit